MLPQTSSASDPRERTFVLILTVLALLMIVSTLFPKKGLDYVQHWILGYESYFGAYADISDPQLRERLFQKYTLMSFSSKMSSSFREALGYRPEGLFITGTPLLYTLFSFTVSGNYTFDLQSFQLVSIAVFSFSFFYLGRRLGQRWSSIVLLFILLSVWFEPLWSDVRVTNVNQLQVALLIVFILLRAFEDTHPRYQFIAMFFLAVAAMIKPTIAFIIPIVLIQRFIARENKQLLRDFIGVALGAILALAIPVYFFQTPRIWLDFIRMHIAQTVSGSYIFAREAGSSSFIAWIATILDVSILHAFTILLLVAPLLLFSSIQLLRRLYDLSVHWGEGKASTLEPIAIANRFIPSKYKLGIFFLAGFISYSTAHAHGSLEAYFKIITPYFADGGELLSNAQWYIGILFYSSLVLTLVMSIYSGFFIFTWQVLVKGERVLWNLLVLFASQFLRFAPIRSCLLKGGRVFSIVSVMQPVQKLSSIPASLVDGALATGAGVGLFLLLSPLSWTHYQLLLIPFVLVALAMFRAEEKLNWVQYALLFALLLLSMSPWRPLLAMVVAENTLRNITDILTFIAILSMTIISLIAIVYRALPQSTMVTSATDAAQ